MTRINTAILISGRGTNMTALIKAAQAQDYPAKIGLVISNRPGVEGLNVAQSHDIATLCINHQDYKARIDFDHALHAELLAHDMQFICCAGFMRILTAEFVAHWKGRLINIHPSLLPKYKGLETHQRALDAGDKIHGCSVHWVTEELDSGAVILQDSVPIKPGDTADSLAARVLEKELSLYPRALKKAVAQLTTQPT